MFLQVCVYCMYLFFFLPFLTKHSMQYPLFCSLLYLLDNISRKFFHISIEKSSTPFLLRAVCEVGAIYYSIVFIFQNLFHQLFINQHLIDFQFLPITDNAAMNNLFTMSFCIYKMCLWDRFLELGLLDEKEHSSVVLLEVAKFFSKGELSCIPLLICESEFF